MSNRFEGVVDKRELELVTREAELNRRESRLRRAAEERAEALDAREAVLNRRETAIATLAAEVAAERERVECTRAQLLAEYRTLEQRRLQQNPRWFAAPEVEASEHEDRWWATQLGREQPAV
jgi:hypothetical protein